MKHSEMTRIAQQADWPAFQRLVIDHQDMAYTLAYYLLGDEEHASSAIQAAFLRAYRELGRFRHGSFRGWLLRRVFESCSGISKTFSTSLPSDYAELHRRLLLLPLKSRAAVILVDLLGMGYEEAAQASGSTPQAVSHLLARGRADLIG